MRFWPRITQELFTTESPQHFSERLMLRFHRAPTGWRGWRELFVPRMYWKGTADETSFRMTYYKHHRPGGFCRGELIAVPDGTRILVHWELTPAAKILLSVFMLLTAAALPLGAAMERSNDAAFDFPRIVGTDFLAVIICSAAYWGVGCISLRLGYWQARDSLLRWLGLPRPKAGNVPPKPLNNATFGSPRPDSGRGAGGEGE